MWPLCTFPQVKHTGINSLLNNKVSPSDTPSPPMFPYSSTPRTRLSGAAGGSRCRLCVRVGRTAGTTEPGAPGAPALCLAPRRRPIWRTEDSRRTARRSGFCCHGDRTRTADLPPTWRSHMNMNKWTQEVEGSCSECKLGQVLQKVVFIKVTKDLSMGVFLFWFLFFGPKKLQKSYNHRDPKAAVP